MQSQHDCKQDPKHFFLDRPAPQVNCRLLTFGTSPDSVNDRTSLALKEKVCVVEGVIYFTVLGSVLSQLSLFATVRHVQLASTVGSDGMLPSLLADAEGSNRTHRPTKY